MEFKFFRGRTVRFDDSISLNAMYAYTRSYKRTPSHHHQQQQAHTYCMTWLAGGVRSFRDMRDKWMSCVIAIAAKELNSVVVMLITVIKWKYNYCR